MSVETYTYHHNNSPYGTLMDGWRKTEDRIVKSQSRVISECYVQASRPGLDQGLCRHHRAQVEGVEGPMGKVPQVVARKGVPAFNTWSTEKFFLKKKKTERYHMSHELEGQEQVVPYQKTRKHAILSSGARRRQWSSISPSCYALR